MSDIMGEITNLLGTDIPEGRRSLLDSHSNLERVAEYCEGNYFQAQDKTQALQETKNYTIQSLASVAYQINTLACNFLHLLDRQSTQLADMESSVNYIAQTVAIYKEKVARREIGILTTNKSSTRQFKIVAPAQGERAIKYVRKPIDFTALDDIGHGVRQIQSQTNVTPRAKRGSSQGNISAGPAPSQKPPTPPQASRTGTLVRNREYRTPTTVAPPQVPSHYAPNYPMGHPRRSEARSSGYSTLPPPPQVGMVHPMQAADRQTMPPPPTPPPVTNMNDYRTYPGNVSPPLPPPPPEQCHTQPEGVPPNYIEKVVAIYDYAADKDDELSFQENALIYVLKKNDDGWWEGVLKGVTGLFPGNYVEPLH